MNILLGSTFVAMLLLCIYMMLKIRQQSFRINQLESAIRGESTGKKIPYESLSLLDSLRRQAKQWNSSEDNPELLTVRPAFIERMDDYLSGIFGAVPELNDRNAVTPVTEPRPLYASLYMTHSVMVWFEPHHVSFPVASREQAERIAGALNAKGIEARWTARDARSLSGPISA
ncbi:hypothetical protein [Pantoea sp. OXWO6B1]|uniref:hypothetical protein n=1 Tax=Pantoea sp. OXWO6B1 TaxID=1835724 RepID=UPI0007C6EF09|nr:hypothetical protein [Pantoea sp. OXWO6B1]OAD98051.1 hypothetical protein A6A26_24235 [Pantoea sp. OXWO6B1]